MPTFGSLFAGIGGIDLGLERAGWECRFQVEWDPFCQRVLAKHWPDVPRYGDITAVDWSGVERVDLLAGGFPCQPFSNAGKRKGVEDDRWLWPEFARAIGELRPRLVLVENVPGLLAGHGGMGRVLGDLAALGYDAEWDSIPASAVGAPHLRYRVWIVAYPNGLGQGWTTALGPQGITGTRSEGAGPEPHGAGARAVPDTDGKRREGEWRGGIFDIFRASRWNDVDGRGSALAYASSNGRQPRRAGDAAQEPGGREPHRSGARQASQPRDGGWWSVEPDVGRVAHGVPNRVDRLRSLGNAVVPQVVAVIGRRLLELPA